MPNVVTMTSYILAAMQYWLPAQTKEDTTRYVSIAHDIAIVSLDDEELPLFKDDSDKRHTALALASVARFEGSFAKNVDEGHCLPHQCDHGKAFTLWQIHPERGLRLSGQSWGFDSGSQRITGEMLVKNRQLAARVALHMMRDSLRRGSLCVYTGESCVRNKHPLADHRLNFAKNYWISHPLIYIETFSAQLM